MHTNGQTMGERLGTDTPPERKALIFWLYACCFMVFCMAVIGAITRLTESGLSIVEWKPLTGALPPLSHAEWQRVYDLYRQSPEFAQKHHWMDLADFQRIFFWEWLHRFWGRMIGLVYALPLAFFWLRGRVPAGYRARLAGILALGALQGAVGWWMVASGLVDRPDVSHYRLAAHLALALAIFSAMWWTALDLGAVPDKTPAPAPAASPPVPGQTPRAAGFACLVLLSVTIVWGAFVAGLDAGKIFNSFPLMNGAFFPDEAWRPAAIVEKHGWVQFTHRWLAVATGLAILVYAWRRKEGPLAGMVFIQIGLGVATLLTQAAIPLAALHQAGAILLLSLLLKALHAHLQDRAAPVRNGDI